MWSRELWTKISAYWGPDLDENLECEHKGRDALDMSGHVDYIKCAFLLSSDSFCKLEKEQGLQLK